jgi:hypothetical protein
MAGINASMRANSAADLQRIFLEPIDRVRSAEMIGTLLGLPFLGYAITIAISSPMLDLIGMGRFCFRRYLDLRPRPWRVSP